jgi:hypothetical protein
VILLKRNKGSKLDAIIIGKFLLDLNELINHYPLLENLY